MECASVCQSNNVSFYIVCMLSCDPEHLQTNSTHITHRAYFASLLSHSTARLYGNGDMLFSRRSDSLYARCCDFLHNKYECVCMLGVRARGVRG